MSEKGPNPNEQHVFQEIDILPVISTPQSAEPSVTGYVMPPTPISKAPQCAVCHGLRGDRIHLAAEQNDSESWPL